MPTLKNIVVVGGGTGTHTILKGLKKFSDEYAISAIVTMADSGGSTGRLRDEFGQLPVGDVRMALVALAEDGDAHDELLRELFLYRFTRGEGLSGHNFGNLLLTALTDIVGSESEAIATAARLLRVAGRVIPVTQDNVHLKAVYTNGDCVVGEHTIDTPPPTRLNEHIAELSLEPRAQLSEAAKTVLREADVIVFGPGDLYTSILANCVVRGFTDAIAESPATIIYVANLMTRPGQTNGMTVADHVRELERYSRRTADYIMVNVTPLPAILVERYAAEGTYPVALTSDVVNGEIRRGDFLATESITTRAGDVVTRSLIRHDSDKVAQSIRALISDIPQ